jgi:hypothetical protein
VAAETRYDMDGITAVSENSSPPARAERLPDELTPDPYSASGSGSRRSDRLTAPDGGGMSLNGDHPELLEDRRAEVLEHWPGARRRQERSRQGEDNWQPPDEWRLPFEVRLAETRAALQRLQARIAEQCPGPHEYVNRRDLLPPWCDACGYTDTGLHRNECGLKSRFDWHRDL